MWGNDNLNLGTKDKRLDAKPFPKTRGGTGLENTPLPAGVLSWMLPPGRLCPPPVRCPSPAPKCHTPFPTLSQSLPRTHTRTLSLVTYAPCDVNHGVRRVHGGAQGAQSRARAARVPRQRAPPNPLPPPVHTYASTAARGSGGWRPPPPFRGRVPRGDACAAEGHREEISFAQEQRSKIDSDARFRRSHFAILLYNLKPH